MSKLFAQLLEKESSLSLAQPANPLPVTPSEPASVRPQEDASDSVPAPRTEVTPNPLPGNRDAVIPRYRDTTTPRHHDTTRSRNREGMEPREDEVMVSRNLPGLIETIRKAVKCLGKESATHRFTSAEKRALGDIIYTYHAKLVRTSENEIARIGLNFLVEDYRAYGETSILARVLEKLNE